MVKKLELDLGALPVSRDLARAQGSKWFFTGKPCKREHLAARLTSSATCMECHNERMKVLYQENPDPFIDRAKHNQYEWRQRDPEGFLKYQRDKMSNWREANPEKNLEMDRSSKKRNHLEIKRRARDRYAKDPEFQKEKTRKWREANPEKVAEQYRQWCRQNPTRVKIKDQVKRARKLNAEGIFNEADLNLIRKWQDDKCVFCRDPFEEVGETIEHIIAVCSGGTNWPWNIALSCPSCNYRKWKKEVIEYCIERGFPLSCPYPR